MEVKFYYIFEILRKWHETVDVVFQSSNHVKLSILTINIFFSKLAATNHVSIDRRNRRKKLIAMLKPRCLFHFHDFTFMDIAMAANLLDC